MKCEHCNKEFGEDTEVFSVQLKGKRFADLPPGVHDEFWFEEYDRSISALVPLPDSEAKRSGYHLIFQTCSQKCCQAFKTNLAGSDLMDLSHIGDSLRFEKDDDDELDMAMEELNNKNKVDQERITAAQNLCYDAMELKNKRDIVPLALNALSFDPNCSDAWNLLAWHQAEDEEQKLRYFMNGATLGEANLPDGIEQEADYPFWMDHNTRPFMRSLAGMHESFHKIDQWVEAIEVGDMLLALNPNDNQGIRYLQLALLLEKNLLLPAKKLLKKYSFDDPIWVWGRVIFGILSKGNLAKSHLSQALQRNPHVEKFIFDRYPIPKTKLDMYAIGEESEAIFIAQNFQKVIDKFPSNVAKNATQKLKSKPANIVPINRFLSD